MQRRPVLYLASSSPQRSRLLSILVSDFEIINPQIDEAPLANEPVEEYVLRLARRKARIGATLIVDTAFGDILVGADTCVVIKDEKLGKPTDQYEARCMLSKLSGQVHQVYSAIAIATAMRCTVASVISNVEFHKLDTAQIDSYLESGESKGRAGAYAIQGRAATFVRRLEGSWSSVIGMPIQETLSLLELAGVEVPLYSNVAPVVKSTFAKQPIWTGEYWV